jgi:transposase
MNDTTLAIDLAKTVFEVAVSTRPGAVNRRRRLTRKQLSRFVEQQPPSTILLEACSSSHYWGRRFQESGHHVLLLHPQDVARYRKGQKTDRTDAKAILEAHRNEDIQPVPIKSPDQQALTSLHRLRSRWMAVRTAGLNTIRGLLREFGLPIPVGAKRVVPQVTAWLDEGTVHPALAPVLRDAVHEIRDLETRIHGVETQLASLGADMDTVQRLRTVPGIGLLTATALVAFVGSPRRFPSGRRFASYLGLVPKEFSSGAVRRRGHIHKRGDVYLRTLLIHGARSDRRGDTPITSVAL